jgi:hypothetical protein
MEKLDEKTVSKRKRESTGSSSTSDNSFQEEVKSVKARSRIASKKRRDLDQPKSKCDTVTEKLSEFEFVPRDKQKMEEKSNKGDNTVHKGTVEATSGVISLDKPKVTNEDLMFKLCANGSEISKLAQTVDELRSALFTVQVENDELKKSVENMRKEQENLQEQLTEARYLAEIADRRAEELDAYSRRNNLRVYGIKEESEKDCEEKVLNIIQDTLKVNVKKEDVEAMHRLGAKKDNNQSSRGIIVRFVNRRNRDSVFYAKKNLRNTGIVIAEDLTKRQYSLLSLVKADTDLCKQAWTKNGFVYMKSQAGRVVQVKNASAFYDQTQRDKWMKELKDHKGQNAVGDNNSPPDNRGEDME